MSKLLMALSLAAIGFTAQANAESSAKLYVIKSVSYTHLDVYKRQVYTTRI